MKTIMINGTAVKVTVETYKRIEIVARIQKIPMGKAVEFCLKKVI